MKLHGAKSYENFHVLFRAPEFPVIVISGDNRLMAAFSLKKLGACCLSAIPDKNGEIVRAVDSTGEEFWFSTKHSVISPGLFVKRWTKKKIIDLYNNECMANDSQGRYPEKSLPNKKLAQIVLEICNLLKSRS